MGLEEVDVVGLQALQGGVQRLDDVLAGQAAVVGVRPGRPVHLGEDLDRVTPDPLEGTSEDGLGQTDGVGICRVERGDAGVERGLHARQRGLFFDLAAVGDPVPVGEG